MLREYLAHFGLLTLLFSCSSAQPTPVDAGTSSDAAASDASVVVDASVSPDASTCKPAGADCSGGALSCCSKSCVSVTPPGGPSTELCDGP